MNAKITTETLAGATEIASVLGVTARRVQQLAQDGVFRREGGKYGLADCVQRYIRYITENAKNDSEDELNRKKAEAEVRIKRAKAATAEIELKELQGKMHRAEDVQDVLTDFAAAVRDQFLALPGKLAVNVANARDAAEAAQILKSEGVYPALDALSRYKYDPDTFAERVKDRRKWEEKAQTEETDEQD